MIIDDEKEESAKAPSSSKAAYDEVEGKAYLEQMIAVDGFTRGPDGKVKFNKNTKKRRAEEALADFDDADMADATRNAKKSKKKEPIRLGQEFKAKVYSPSCFQIHPLLLMIAFNRMLAET
jgi:ribosomal RNA-processing protein 12